MKLTAFVLLALTASAWAEDSGPKPADQAWDAYRAGKNLDHGAVPRLTEMIRTVPKNDEKARRLVVRAAFDALIRLKAPVPSKVLEPYLGGRFRTQALILIAGRAAEHTETLLKVFDRQTGKTMGAFGIAVGNLLSATKAPGFAPRLLRRVEMTLTILVADEWMSGNIGVGISGGAGDGRIDVPAGFPPTVFYKLTIRKESRGVLLADGPHPVRYTRRERTGRLLGTGSSYSNKNTPDLVREWLAALTGMKVKALGIPEKQNVTIVFADVKQYTAEATKARNALVMSHRKLVKALVAKNLLSDAEARALKPSLTVKIDDRRKKQDVKLPKLPAPPKAE